MTNDPPVLLATDPETHKSRVVFDPNPQLADIDLGSVSILPALFLIATVYLMISTLIATPGRVLAGLGIVALGLPLYAYYARRLPPSLPEDWLFAGEAAPTHEDSESLRRLTD